LVHTDIFQNAAAFMGLHGTSCCRLFVGIRCFVLEHIFLERLSHAHRWISRDSFAHVAATITAELAH